MRAASGDATNVMPHLIECAETDATLGGAVDATCEVFGAYEESPIL